MKQQYCQVFCIGSVATTLLCSVLVETLQDLPTQSVQNSNIVLRALGPGDMKGQMDREMEGQTTDGQTDIRHSICPFIHKSICLSVHQSVCLSIHLSGCPSINPSICPSMCQCVYQTVNLYIIYCQVLHFFTITFSFPLFLFSTF